MDFAWVRPGLLRESWPGAGGPRARPRARPPRGDGGGGGRGQPAADGGAGVVDVRGHVAGGVPGVAAVGVREAPRVGPRADHRRGGQYRPAIQALRGRARGPPAGRAEQAGARAHEGRRGARRGDARTLEVLRGAEPRASCAGSLPSPSRPSRMQDRWAATDRHAPSRSSPPLLASSLRLLVGHDESDAHEDGQGRTVPAPR